MDNRIVRLTNLNKPFWPKLGVTKRDLIQYYPTSPPCSCLISSTVRW